MGFKVKSKTYTLAFSGEDYEGLEIVMRGLSVGAYLDLQRVMTSTEDSAQDSEELLSIFGGSVVRWNLEDEDDNPVKPTMDGLREVDLDFVLKVTSVWMKAMSSVSEDLGKDSNSGQRYPEVNLPTELLSVSLAN